MMKNTVIVRLDEAELLLHALNTAIEALEAYGTRVLFTNRMTITRIVRTVDDAIDDATFEFTVEPAPARPRAPLQPGEKEDDHEKI